MIPSRILLFYLSLCISTAKGLGQSQIVIGQDESPPCPLPRPHKPSSHDGHPDSSTFWATESVKKQVDRMLAVVTVPSVCYDDMGDVDKDERYRAFDVLHEVLEGLFPLVHKHAHLQKVNLYGLIFTLLGTQTDLKPVMFTAHQDVVPADNSDSWKYPPFEPVYDGTWLWGRGSCDCKNNLVGTLSAVERLLENGSWRPRRTIILVYGFDEECDGWKGAAQIAEVLQDRWGKDGIAFILDEGGMGLDTKGDVIYALPAVHEKSALEVFIDLQIQGGHASKPPAHSGIGILAEVVQALEANPYQPVLLAGSPYYQHLVCQAKYSPHADPWLAEALRKDQLKYVAERIATRSPEIRFRIQTSQAVDLIKGGSKINALPEQVSIGIDYRIAQHDSISGIKSNIAHHLAPIAERFSLRLSAFSDLEEPEDAGRYNGTLRLRTGDESKPTPISPTTNSAIWDEFSATVQHVYSDYANTVVPVGDIMNGNTDTRHYLNLSRNIYRWSPARLGTRLNAHAVDERLDVTAHIDGLRLYYDLIRNFDSWEGDME